MKLSEYLKHLDNVSDFSRWYKKEWLPWTPPKRKIRIYCDANLPEKFVDELKEFKNFKVVCRAGVGDDEDHYVRARQQKAILITSDLDFWDDRRFPLKKSPGVVVIVGKTIRDLDIAFGRFLGYAGHAGRIPQSS